MIFISILIIIVAIALPSLRKQLSPILLLRISTIIMIYAGALSLNAFYIQTIGSGIGIYSGLFHVTSLSQQLDIFLLSVVSLIYIPGLGIFELITLYQNNNLTYKNNNKEVKLSINNSRPEGYNIYPSMSKTEIFKPLKRVEFKIKILSHPVIQIYNLFLIYFIIVDVLSYLKNKILWILHTYFIIVNLPSGYKPKNIKIALSIIFLVFTTFIFTSNIYLKLENYSIFSQLSKVLFILSLFLFIFLVFNLFLRLFNILIKSSINFIKDNNVSTGIKVSYYIINLFYVVVSLLFLNRLNYSLINYNNEISDYLNLFSFLSFIISLIYIEAYNESNYSLSNNLKFTKVHYFLQFFTFFLVILYLSNLFTFYTCKINDIYLEYNNKYTKNILNLTRNYMLGDLNENTEIPGFIYSGNNAIIPFLNSTDQYGRIPGFIYLKYDSNGEPITDFKFYIELANSLVPQVLVNDTLLIKSIFTDFNSYNRFKTMDTDIIHFHSNNTEVSLRYLSYEIKKLVYTNKECFKLRFKLVKIIDALDKLISNPNKHTELPKKSKEYLIKFFSSQDILFGELNKLSNDLDINTNTKYTVSHKQLGQLFIQKYLKDVHNLELIVKAVYNRVFIPYKYKCDYLLSNMEASYNNLEFNTEYYDKKVQKKNYFIKYFKYFYKLFETVHIKEINRTYYQYQSNKTQQNYDSILDVTSQKSVAVHMKKNLKYI